MDADVAAMQRFAEVPYAVAGPAAKSGLVGAAAAAVAKSRPAIRFDDSRGLPPERYSAMVREIREGLARDLAPTPGFKIDVFDLAAKDQRAEGARIAPNLTDAGPLLRKYLKQRGAFTVGFKIKEGVSCTVVGFAPDSRIVGTFAKSAGMRDVDASPVDAAMLHRFTLLHENGHCLLGGSEAKADAFMALRVLQDPEDRTEALAFFASLREASERTLFQTDDDHFTSKALWAVLERAPALRADPEFRAMGLQELAGLAKAIVEERGLTPEAEAEAASVRRALRAGLDVASPGGNRVVDPLLGWLARNRAIPEFGRLLALRDNLVSGSPRVLPGHDAVPGAFRASIAALAAAGDRIATAMAKAYDAKPDPNSPGAREVASAHASPLDKVIPYAYPRTAFVGRAIAYGRAPAAEAAHVLQASEHDDDAPAGPRM